jgi:hypothetical protein
MQIQMDLKDLFCEFGKIEVTLLSYTYIITFLIFFCHCSPVFDDKELFDDFSCLI